MENVPAFAHELTGCDVLFHTASYFREYYGPGDHRAKLEAINVLGTLAFAELAHASSMRRMIQGVRDARVGSTYR
jgi:dihydroflavonol-4-reductase